MNKGIPTSNRHVNNEYRLGRQPDLSEQIAHYDTYNFALTKERDLDRFRTVYSSKTHIVDQSRVVSPTNYFGIRHISAINPRQLFCPAGMDGENSRVQSGIAFTQPVRPNYSQVL
jgi:hypothetical protein